MNISAETIKSYLITYHYLCCQVVRCTS